MTPVQEALNAITMVLPTAALLLLGRSNNYQRALLLGTAAHLPVSFAYHMGMALGMFHDRLDNRLRRWDQGMQHVLCVVFSWALSHGSVKFTMLNGLINTYFVAQIFRKNDGRRWIPVAACTALYTLPMLWRGDAENYAKAMLSIAAGGLAFVPEINMRLFNGWGHSCIFHVALSYFAQALWESLLLD